MSILPTKFGPGAPKAATDIFPATPSGTRSFEGTVGLQNPPKTADSSATRGPCINMGLANSQGMRDHMEDAYTMVKDFKLGGQQGTSAVFLALFDGHSGKSGSQHASKRLHQILAQQPAMQQVGSESSQQVPSQPDHVAIESALKTAFEQADEEIIQQAQQQSKRTGTTAVCALFLGDKLHVAHAGDSRAVLCHGNTAVKLTKDHKPASDPNERARIEALGGKISYDADRVLSNPEAPGPQSRLNMSRALGDAGHKFPRPLVKAEPDVAHIDLNTTDRFVVLGTDGLFDVMGAGDCCALVNRVLESTKTLTGDKLAGAAAEALVAEALRRQTVDNVTAAVALLNWN